MADFFFFVMNDIAILKSTSHLFCRMSLNFSFIVFRFRLYTFGYRSDAVFSVYNVKRYILLNAVDFQLTGNQGDW